MFPLLDGTSADYLSEEVKRDVHSAVAHTYLSQRRIGPQDAFQLCLHLLGAHEYLTLAIVVAQIMQSVDTVDEARLVAWATILFPPGYAWPDQIPNFLRMLVRTQQISHLRLLGGSTDAHETELVQLVAHAGTSALDVSAVAHAHFQLGVRRESLNAVDASRGGLEAARSLRRADELLRSEYPDQFGAKAGALELMIGPPEQLFWGGVPKLASVDDARAVVGLLGEVAPEERRLLVDSAPGPDLAVLVAERCIQLETEKPRDQRDWASVLAILNQLEDSGRAPGCQPLRVAALRARAITLADHMGQTERALTQIDLGKSWAEGDDAQVLNYVRGRVLHAHGRSPEALNASC